MTFTLWNLLFMHCLSKFASKSEFVVDRLSVVSCPDPALSGLVTIERFLGCAESTVLILDQPMK